MPFSLQGSHLKQFGSSRGPPVGRDTTADSPKRTLRVWPKPSSIGQKISPATFQKVNYIYRQLLYYESVFLWFWGIRGLPSKSAARGGNLKYHPVRAAV